MIHTEYAKHVSILHLLFSNIQTISVLIFVIFLQCNFNYELIVLEQQVYLHAAAQQCQDLDMVAYSSVESVTAARTHPDQTSRSVAASTSQVRCPYLGEKSRFFT